jgi:hypothetical protein
MTAMHTPHLEDLGTCNSCVDVAGELVESVDIFDDRDMRMPNCQNNGSESCSNSEMCRPGGMSRAVFVTSRVLRNVIGPCT